MELIREETLKNILYSNLSDNMKIRLVEHIKQLTESDLETIYIEEGYLGEGFMADVLTTTAIIAIAQRLVPQLNTCRSNCKRSNSNRTMARGCIFKCEIAKNNASLNLAKKQVSACAREKNPERCKAKVARGISKLQAKNSQLKQQYNSWKIKKTQQGKQIS